MKAFKVLMITLVSIWLTGFAWFASHTTGSYSPPPERAGAIVVLTGGSGRISEGLKLFSDGKAPKLFITGVNKRVSIETIKNQWNGSPLPDCCIELGYLAENTRGNAVEGRDWLLANEIDSIYLVTSNYHMPRAKLEFAYATTGLAIYPHPVISNLYRQNTLRYMQYLLNEYHKTVATFFRNFLTSDL